jgi:hypothetical protein
VLLPAVSAVPALPSHHRCAPGYYLKGPGQVAPCPKGGAESGYDAVAACSKCAEGVTTLAEASTNQAACVSVLPTYYPSSIQTLVVDNATVGDLRCQHQEVPQKFSVPVDSPLPSLTLQHPPCWTAPLWQCAPTRPGPRHRSFSREPVQ